jgi:hypothetical protein
MFFVIDASEALSRSAAKILGQYPGAKIHHADAIHLATADLVRSRMDPGDLFVLATADSGMQDVAEALGFSVFNPDRHDISDLRSLIGY